MLNHPLEESWHVLRNRKRQEQARRHDTREGQIVILMCLLAAVLAAVFL